MLHLTELRINDLFEFQTSSEEERSKIGSIKKIGQRQVLIEGKWLSIDRLIPISVTKDTLLHAGFKQFDWLRDSSVFECNYFKCIVDDNGMNLFCDTLKNLKPVKYLHQLQNIYFDLTGEELEVNVRYFKLVNAEML